MEKNKILTGSAGQVWLSGQLLGTLTSIQAKVTGKFEEQNFCGDFGTYNVYAGWSGEGTLKFGKVDSTVIKTIADGYKTGVFPDIKIITKLTDIATGKSERIAISGLVISEFYLANFESKKVIEDEIPFKFSQYDILETI